MTWTRKARLRALEGLDLAPVRLLLVQKEGWTEDRAEEAEAAYRRFLELLILHPRETLVPTEEVDAFWHMHILDSRKYERDSKSVFGKYLHHDPHLAKGTAAHEKALKRTRELEQAAAGSRAQCGAMVAQCVGAAGGTSSGGGRAADPDSAADGDGGGGDGGGTGDGGGGGASCGSSCGGGGGCGGGGD